MIQRIVVELWPHIVMVVFLLFGWWLICNDDLTKVQRVSQAIAMVGTQIILYCGGFYDRPIHFFFGG